jgi:hypothetical protein
MRVLTLYEHFMGMLISSHSSNNFKHYFSLLKNHSGISHGTASGDLELEMTTIEHNIANLRRRPEMRAWVKSTRRPVKVRKRILGGRSY